MISNRTRAARAFDFEITRMISDQIALHSVQLPLIIIIIMIMITIIDNDNDSDSDSHYNNRYAISQASWMFSTIYQVKIFKDFSSVLVSRSFSIDNNRLIFDVDFYRLTLPGLMLNPIKINH